MSTLLVTGGAGFIGSNFVHLVRAQRPEWRIVVLDALTYAGNRANLDGLDGITFLRGDIAEPTDVQTAFEEAISRQESHSPQGVTVGPWTQLSALARMRAVVVLPTPRAPENR